MSLYSRVGSVSNAITRFVQAQGTGHSVMLGELALYGYRGGPMLAGRIMREYAHVVAADCRLLASVSYDTAARCIVVAAPLK